MWFRKADKWPAISILRSVVIGTHRGASVSACLLVTTRCKDEYEQNQIVCIVKEPGRVQGTSAPDRSGCPNAAATGLSVVEKVAVGAANMRYLAAGCGAAIQHERGGTDEFHAEPHTI